MNHTMILTFAALQCPEKINLWPGSQCESLCRTKLEGRLHLVQVALICLKLQPDNEVALAPTGRRPTWLTLACSSCLSFALLISPASGKILFCTRTKDYSCFIHRLHDHLPATSPSGYVVFFIAAHSACFICLRLSRIMRDQACLPHSNRDHMVSHFTNLITLSSTLCSGSIKGFTARRLEAMHLPPVH